MPAAPRPLWNGYDETSEDDLLALLDGAEAAANDPDDETVQPAVPGGLAHAIAQHEEIKRKLDPDNYRPRLHARANVIAESWKP
jgi:hypothetical protein